jgi:hypothetical protein
MENLNMETINVSNSSMISTLTYDRDAQELIVTFKNGGQYKYFDVPPELFSEMSTITENLGKFFTANVKTKFRFEKI